jgi:PilZ domain
MSSEKRDAARLDILGELQGEVSILAPLTIKEISLGGALVETAFPLQLNSLHEFRLELGGRTVVLRGRIAHCRIADVGQDVVVYRAGLEFIEPSDHVVEAVESYIEHVRRERGLTSPIT